MTLAVTLLTAILLTITGAIFSQFFQQELQTSISEQNFTLVSSLAREIDSKLQASRQHLSGIAHNVTPSILSEPTKAKEFLESQGGHQFLFDNGLFLFSSTLKLLASKEDEAYQCATECPFEKYLKKTLETKTPQISEPFFSTQKSGHPLIMFTAPVFSKEGEVTGILAGNLDLLNNNFLGLLSEVRLGKDGYLYLYNQERTIIVHPNRDRILQQDVPLGVNKMFDQALNGFEGTDETVTSKGLHALSSFKRLSTNNWILAANFPLVEAYAPVRQARHNFLLVLITLLLVSALTTWFLMRRMTAPFGDLTRQILAYSDYESIRPVKIATRDEIGALARTFNQILTKLAEKERALREQVHFLQVLLDVMPNPVFFKDTSGRYLGCNTAFERNMGIAKGAMKGKSVFEVVPLDLAETYYQADKDLLDQGPGKTQVYEASVKWFDGKPRPVIFYKATFCDPDGNLAGLVGTILDISERKRAETELEEQKQFSEKLLQYAAAAAFVLDADHQVIVWNRACEELTGIPAKGIIGTDGHWRAFFNHPRPCLADLIIDKKSRELPLFYTSFKKCPLVPEGLVAEGWREMNGKKSYLVFNAAPIHNAAGKLIAVIQTVEDLTDRKKTEEDLSKSLSLLEATLESTGDGILVIDLQGKIVTWNKRFAGMWGLSEEDLTNGNDKVLLSLVLNQHQNSEVFLAKIKELAEHPERESWEVLQLKNGKIFEGLSMPQKLGDKIVGRVWSFRDITRQRQIIDQLNKLSLAVEQSPNTVVITDPAGHIEYVNPMFTKTTGYSPEEVFGKNPRFLKSGTFPEEYYRTLWQTIMAGREWRGEFHNKKENGELFWESALISPLKNEEGVITHLVAVKEDITKKKVAEQRQLLTGQVLGILSLPNTKTDKTRDILQMIKDFTGMEGVGLRLMQNNSFSYQNALGVGKFFDSGKCPLSNSETVGEKELNSSLCGRIFLGHTHQLPETTLSPGKSFWTNNGLANVPCLCPSNPSCRSDVQSMALISLHAGEKSLGLLELHDRESGKLSLGKVEFLETLASTIGIALEHRKAETRLQEKENHLNILANYDSLTRLPNRSLFCDRLQHSLIKAKDSGEKVALLLLDIDRFKTINDSLGHDCGDKILCQVAERLKVQIKESDTLARFGGDEFALILEDVASPKNVLIMGQKIIQNLSSALSFEGYQLYLTASIGISMYPNDGEDLETLLKYAEIAMYRAKEQGRNNCQFYRPEMNIRSKEILFLEGALRQGLEQEQFVLHYQPQIDLASGQVVGAEALVRWCHPTLGMVPPGDFISLAEETGLIVPLGEWILRTACHQIKKWNDGNGTPVRVAVNISARQFQEPDFIDKVDLILLETGIDPTHLEMEITESVIMVSVEDAIMTLTDLKIRGINLAIDDFGTGYSSLSYLQKFPITHLKIDRSFIKNVCSNEQSAEIASSIIALAQNMQLRVIAEGVETVEQMKFLKGKGCNEGQGFLFSRPLPPKEMEESFL